MKTPTVPASGVAPEATVTPTASNVGGLGFLLDRVAHSLSRAFADVLDPYGMTATSLGLLAALLRWGPRSQSELAAFLGVERQQALHLVDTLSGRGWVKRTARASDRRVWDVTITIAGRRAYEEAALAVRSYEAEVFDELDPREREQLAGTLGVLRRHGRYPRVLAPLEERRRAPSAPGRGSRQGAGGSDRAGSRS